MTADVQHPDYPDRMQKTVVFKGQTLPGWWTGKAAVWTGGHSPRVVGPFDDVEAAMQWQVDHAPGSVIHPYEEPSAGKLGADS